MNDNILQGKWKQLKGDVQKQWGKLTDDDVDRISGSRSKLIGKLQERYGKAQKEVEEEVADFFERYD